MAKRIASLFVILFSLAMAGTANAGGQWPAYTDAAFQEATKDGKGALVVVHASWCTTCARQEKVMESFADDPALKHVPILIVDFDEQKDIVSKLGVYRQSTIIAFKGGKEIGRVLGETREPQLRALWQSTL